MCDECPTPGQQCKRDEAIYISSGPAETQTFDNREEGEAKFEAESKGALVRVTFETACPNHGWDTARFAMGLQGQTAETASDDSMAELIKQIHGAVTDHMQQVVRELRPPRQGAFLVGGANLLKSMQEMINQMVTEAEAEAEAAKRADTPCDQAKDDAVVGTAQTV